MDSERWQSKIMKAIEEIPDRKKGTWGRVDAHRRQCQIKVVYSMVAKFERLKEKTSLLELTLWRRVLLLGVDEDDESEDRKLDYRVRCGAGVVIPNVLAFLSIEEEGRKRTSII